MKVKFNIPAYYSGVKYAIGEFIEVDDETALWLIASGVVTQITA